MVINAFSVLYLLLKGFLRAIYREKKQNTPSSSDFRPRRIHLPKVDTSAHQTPLRTDTVQPANCPAPEPQNVFDIAENRLHYRFAPPKQSPVFRFLMPFQLTPNCVCILIYRDGSAPFAFATLAAKRAFPVIDTTVNTCNISCSAFVPISAIGQRAPFRAGICVVFLVVNELRLMIFFV